MKSNPISVKKGAATALLSERSLNNPGHAALAASQLPASNEATDSNLKSRNNFFFIIMPYRCYRCGPMDASHFDLLFCIMIDHYAGIKRRGGPSLGSHNVEINEPSYIRKQLKVL